MCAARRRVAGGSMLWEPLESNRGLGFRVGLVLPQCCGQQRRYLCIISPQGNGLGFLHP